MKWPAKGVHKACEFLVRGQARMKLVRLDSSSSFDLRIFVSRFSYSLGLFDTQHNMVHLCMSLQRYRCPCKDIVQSFSVTASVSIQVSQPYINIEMHAAYNSWICGFSFGFRDLSLANAANPSPRQTCISCSIEPTQNPRYFKSSTMLMGLSLINSSSIVLRHNLSNPGIELELVHLLLAFLR